MFNPKTFNGPVPTNFTPEQTTAWNQTREQFQAIINTIEKNTPGSAGTAALASLYQAYCVTQTAIQYNWKQTY